MSLIEHTIILRYFATLFLKKVITATLISKITYILTIFQTIYRKCEDKLVCYHNRGDKELSKKDSAIINEIDKARLKLSIEHYIKYFIGKRTREINKDEALDAIALAVREFAMDKMYETIARYNKVNTKRVYYLSIEYLIGRSLENNLHNLGLFNILKNIKIDGFPEDISLEEIFDAEYDPALGYGGLGRLAACYQDTMASLGIPGFGYGIN